MTWGQIWQSMQNTAVMAFQPVLQRLNGMANSDAFQGFVDGAIEAMATTANMVLNIFDLVGSVAGFVADHWSIIEPIILGVAAAIIIYTAFTKGAEIASRAASLATNAWTAAQGAFNAVMSMNPVGLVIIAVVLLIAIIYAAVAAVNHFAGTSVSATGLICGAFATALAFIGNLFIGAVNTIIGIGVTLWNLIANFVNAFALIFNNPIAGIEALFLSLFNFIVEVIESAARMLDAVFGSSLADAVAGFQNKVQAKVDAVISENGGSEILKTVDMSDYQSTGSIMGTHGTQDIILERKLMIKYQISVCRTSLAKRIFRILMIIYLVSVMQSQIPVQVATLTVLQMIPVQSKILWISRTRI